MKKAVGIGVPLVLIVAVAVYLAMTGSKNQKPGHHVIERAVEMPDYLQEALKKAAAEDAPKDYVPDKRFLGAIASLASKVIGKCYQHPMSSSG
ncbi:Hypp8043 [Branchiostoma lanceolatum]|uniref:Hypp8043 protein n=1 Tax=Branchiostoma lanceolatum TaxID=7740 RepID=A0A8K0EEG1_BRALA|nr:Hypp8043 [Branchiostoma lanceolatum]